MNSTQGRRTRTAPSERRGDVFRPATNIIRVAPENKVNLGDNPRAKREAAIQALPTITDDIAAVKWVSMTSDQIRSNSVVEVSSMQSDPAVINGVNSILMGPVDSSMPCKTCNFSYIDCPGHFGHINLGAKHALPLTLRGAISLASIVAPCCARIAIAVPDENRVESIRNILIAEKIYGMPNETRLREIETRLKSTLVCPRANMEDHIDFSQFPSGTTVSMLPEFVGEYPYNMRNYGTVAKDLGRSDTLFYKIRGVRDVEDEKFQLNPDQLYNILRRIPPDELELLGFPPNAADYLIVDCIPVIPPRFRRQIPTSNGTREEATTSAYTALLTATISNKPERRKKSEKMGDINGKSVYVCLVELMIKSHGVGGRGDAFIQFLSGKDGQVRKNMSGKRADSAARTVLSPAPPGVELGQVGMPSFIVNGLKIIETITPHNLAYYQREIEEGRISHYKRAHDNMDDFRDRRKCNHTTQIRPGDAVFRRVAETDYLIQNRQPSLNRQSMMAHNPVVNPPGNNALKLNMADTPAFHADFDGDEGNSLAPQSEQARAEARQLLNVTGGSIYNTANSTNIYGMVGSFVYAAATCSEGIFDPRVIRACIARRKYPIRTYDELLAQAEALGMDDTAGALIISSLFPDTFVYGSGDMQIVQGILVYGVVNMNHLGSNKARSIIQMLDHNYGTETMRRFITDATRVFAFFNNEFHGFSVGIGDVIPDEKYAKMEEQYYMQIVGRCEQFFNSEVIDAESIMRPIISDYTSSTVALTEQFLKEDPSNAYNQMVRIAGSKGNVPGVRGMFISVGQQYVEGFKRAGIPSQGGRSLPYFDPESRDLEAGGMIRGNWVKGMTLQEMAIMEIPAREASIQSTNTLPTVGFALRKATRTTEGVMVNNNGGVLNTHGIVISQTYEDGYSAEKLIRGNNGLVLMDFNSYVDRYLCSKDVVRLRKPTSEREEVQVVADAHNLKLDIDPEPRFTTFPALTRFEVTRLIAGVADNLNSHSRTGKGIPIPADIGPTLNNSDIAIEIIRRHPEMIDAEVTRELPNGEKIVLNINDFPHEA